MPQSAAVPHRDSLWPFSAKEAAPRFCVHRSDGQSPGRAQRGLPGVGKDKIALVDRLHPFHSSSLACAATATSRGLGVRVAGAPRRVAAATAEEDAGVMPAGRGQLRTKAHTLL